MNKRVLVEVSARHVHLSRKDFEKLFGKNSGLHHLKKLSQEDEFASKEKVEIINGGKSLVGRVLGPLRKESQVEISVTDAIRLRLKKIPPIKVSGDHTDTFGIALKGPKGKLILKKGLIIAERHLHCSTEDAKRLRLRHDQIIKIKIAGKRGLIFDHVIVRIKPNFMTAAHLDTDEGNAAGIFKETFGEIVD